MGLPLACLVALCLALTWAEGTESRREGRTRNHGHSVCSTWGDSHYKTFDGDVFRFPGLCDYNFASDCRDAYKEFAVHLKRGPGRSGGHPQIEYILLTVKDDTIYLTPQLAVVNGAMVSTPHYSSGLLIEKSDAYTKVYSRAGLALMWDREDSLMLELDSKFQNHTCGLCGDYNGLQTYSEFLSDGVVFSPIEFGNLQKINKPEVVCEDPEEVPASESCSEHRAECESLLTGTAFEDCQGLVPLQPYVQACVQDRCQCAQGGSCVCSTVAEFSRQCSHAGGRPGNWRTATLCAKSCPGNMVYLESGSPCVDTCSHLEVSSLCEEHRMDGCFCPEGTVYDDIAGGGCIPVSQCHCKLHGRLYKPGEQITSHCEQCECDAGRWVCTDLQCPGTCALEGGAHISTFDGRKYTFHGDCYYVLTKDAHNDSYAVLGELTSCGSTDKQTCLKTVVLLADSKKNVVAFKSDGSVLLNELQVNLPHVTASFSIFQPSSHHLLVSTAFGLRLQVQLLPVMQLFLTLDPAAQGHVQGLCGNFNGLEGDDFQTAGGLVEATGAGFANTWKAQSSCQDKVDWLDDPCSLSIESANYAEHWCSLLKKTEAPFGRCHSAVDPAEYYKRCKYDTCNCQSSEDCMCAALSSYAHACAAKGVLLWGWREGVCNKDVGSCPTSQLFLYNLTTCQRTCRSLSESDTRCLKGFLPVDGCGCPDQAFLDEKGRCVPLAKCSCYHHGLYLEAGEVVLRQEERCVCQNGRLLCKQVRLIDQNCMAPKIHVDCNNLTALAIRNPRAASCQTLAAGSYQTECISGCVCPEGLLDDGQGGCVVEEQCPCVHNSDVYPPGAKIRVDCNTCTCQKGRWACTQSVCHGTCAVYGNGHYITFDGKYYDFDGHCSYVAVQDYCGQNSSLGSFSIVTENVPCGTTGVTCSKAIKIFLGRTELKLEDRHCTVIPLDVGHHVAYTTREVGQYLVVEASTGVIVIWDKRTTIFIKLAPSYKGTVCGLCGNFDQRSSNDFTTRDRMVVESELDFGNSWKEASTCPDVSSTPEPCTLNWHRRSWAEKQCSIIKSWVFRTCHSKVDPKPFYEACVHDSCSCDTGGDCECFCSAVASYAQECTKEGACVTWRTPELCPVFCDYYNPPHECEWHYEPCGNRSFETCRSLSGIHSNISVSYLEGCYPRCPKNRPIYDEDLKKCVRGDECGCYVEDTRYRPGVSVPTEKPCQSWYCTKSSKVVCRLEEGKILNYTEIGPLCYWELCGPNGTIEKHLNICRSTTPPSTSTTTTTPVTTTSTTPSTATTTTPSTTSSPVSCCWSDWINGHHPSGSSDDGDWETFDHVCTTPRDIECRAATEPHLSWGELGQETKCNVSFGFICKNEDQFGIGPFAVCYDYEIRVYCCEKMDWCAPTPTTTIPTTTPTTTSTEPPTPGSTTTETTTPSTTTTMETTTPSTTTTTETTTPSTTTTTKTTTPTPIISTTSTGTPTATPTTTSTVTPTPTFTTSTEPPTSTSTTTETSTPSTTTATSTATTSCVPVCSWTGWLDSAKPNFTKEGGDIEAVENVCKMGSVASISCRAAMFPSIPLQELGQTVVCDTSVGLVCKNQDQKTGGATPMPYCLNYEINVYCCVPLPGCQTTYPSTTPEAVARHPPPPQQSLDPNPNTYHVNRASNFDLHHHRDLNPQHDHRHVYRNHFMCACVQLDRLAGFCKTELYQRSDPNPNTYHVNRASNFDLHHHRDLNPQHDHRHVYRNHFMCACVQLDRLHQHHHGDRNPQHHHHHGDHNPNTYHQHHFHRYSYSNTHHHLHSDSHPNTHHLNRASNFDLHHHRDLNPQHDHRHVYRNHFIACNSRLHHNGDHNPNTYHQHHLHRASNFDLHHHRDLNPQHDHRHVYRNHFMCACVQLDRLHQHHHGDRNPQHHHHHEDTTPTPIISTTSTEPPTFDLHHHRDLNPQHDHRHVYRNHFMCACVQLDRLAGFCKTELYQRSDPNPNTYHVNRASNFDLHHHRDLNPQHDHRHVYRNHFMCACVQLDRLAGFCKTELYQRRYSYSDTHHHLHSDPNPNTHHVNRASNFDLHHHRDLNPQHDHSHVYRNHFMCACVQLDRLAGFCKTELYQRRYSYCDTHHHLHRDSHPNTHHLNRASNFDLHHHRDLNPQHDHRHVYRNHFMCACVQLDRLAGFCKTELYQRRYSYSDTHHHLHSDPNPNTHHVNRASNFDLHHHRDLNPQHDHRHVYRNHFMCACVQLDRLAGFCKTELYQRSDPHPNTHHLNRASNFDLHHHRDLNPQHDHRHVYRNHFMCACVQLDRLAGFCKTELYQRRYSYCDTHHHLHRDSHPNTHHVNRASNFDLHHHRDLNPQHDHRLVYCNHFMCACVQLDRLHDHHHGDNNPQHDNQHGDHNPQHDQQHGDHNPNTHQQHHLHRDSYSNTHHHLHSDPNPNTHPLSTDCNFYLHHHRDENPAQYHHRGDHIPQLDHHHRDLNHQHDHPYADPDYVLPHHHHNRPGCQHHSAMLRDEVRYNVTEGGMCHYAYCLKSCELEFFNFSCPSTPSTTLSPPTTTTTAPSSTASSVSTTLTRGCLDFNPPRKENETWWLCNCTMAVCKHDSTVELVEVECDPPPMPTCSNGLTPVRVKDPDGCCWHWECDCYCTGWGDPHYVTFDGLYYSHQGACTYVLVEEAVPTVDGFGVYVDNYHCDPRDRVSCPRTLIVRHETQEVRLETVQMAPMTVQVQVNRQAVALPYKKYGLQVYESGINLVVAIPELGALVSYNGLAFSIRLPYRLFGNNTKGQCGTCTNTTVDDCVLPSGEVVDNCEVAADQWAVNDPSKPQCPHTSFTTQRPATSPSAGGTAGSKACASPLCELIKDSLFAQCHALVPPQHYYDACVFDSCFVPDSGLECASLQTYAALCAQEGICVDWRNHTRGACPVKCPAHREYRACGPAEEPTCQSSPSQENSTQLVEGCFCPEGTVNFAPGFDVCVDSCGCVGPDNVPREFGEHFQFDCKDCICLEGGSGISCQPRACSQDPRPECGEDGTYLVTEVDPTDPCCSITSCKCNASLCREKPLLCPLGFEVKREMVPGRCCPLHSCVPKGVCVVENAEYQPGSPVYSSKCQNCVCTTSRDSATQLNTISCSHVPCNTSCNPGFELVDVPGECCKKCQQTHCIIEQPSDQHLVLKPGDMKNDPLDNCTLFSCVKLHNQLISSVSKITCPDFDPSTCLPGSISLMSNGCCRKCIPRNESGIPCSMVSVIREISHNGCTKLVSMNDCSGSCGTFAMYSAQAQALDHRCSCCKEQRTSQRQVALQCPGGGTLSHTYTHIESCGCQDTTCELLSPRDRARRSIPRVLAPGRR
ncbi:LOW QUALITY PROTEIN: mucin-2-like [Camelus ferus]|uniref:LOW QUALITY PROTEIN: mucin-2-like n=1 Tax=Camelus ferus TaxID=419612 RepID=A0A8B8TWW5_CAMFR|nr:LOW QUALITY PROTEIN: mucin-2-like [Camelus ferus]